MSFARTIRSAIMRRMADGGARDRRRAQAEAKRQRQGRPHEVRYFHQPDDPYSHLAAQVLRRFTERYDVRLRPCVVAQPTPIAIHEKQLWDAWARRDAAAIAPFYGLASRDLGHEPEPSLVDRARRILLNVVGSAQFPEIAVAVGTALQREDAVVLEALATAHGVVAPPEAAARLAENFALRHELGHYLGAMFHYEGEWYWGIDRLHYLEARLDALGARRAGAPAGPSARLQRRAPDTLESRERVTLEYFPSVRSPYTHLSYDRVADLCRRYPVDLVVRPVLPMMMRGVKADRRKGQYILFDTRREAERLGVPFGNIWDPFGDPVRRCYSLFPWARERGRGFEYLREYSYAVWSERLNAWQPEGLRQIVERAGLSWSEAQSRLDTRDWEAEMERNVRDMIGAGSWGVPTLRLPATATAPEFTAWGQDRLWLIEEEIARRLGAVPQAAGKAA
jgi:2-hydroxychromene-2-carboxylate isomerase